MSVRLKIQSIRLIFQNVVKPNVTVARVSLSDI